MQIARDEIYRIVSEKPLSKVAPGLGITATALAQLCRSNQIPYPGSGYWTKKSLGLPVGLEPLPPIEGGVTMIEVARRATRARVTPALTELEGGPPSKNDSGSVTIHAPPPATAVPSRLTKPHRIIADWLHEREERIKKAAKSRDPWERRFKPSPWTELDRRRHRILDALFKAIEARGGTVALAEKGLLRATIDSQKIDFQVREKARQVKLPADGKSRPYPSTELVGTGNLVFAIRTYLRGPHNEEWKETEKRPLEAQLPQIVDRLFDGAQILKAWRIERDAETERWRLEREQQAEVQRRRQLDQARKEELIKLSNQWETTKRLRAYLTEIRSTPHDASHVLGDKPLRDWFAWAEAFVTEQEVKTGTAMGLFIALEKVTLK